MRGGTRSRPRRSWVAETTAMLAANATHSVRLLEINTYPGIE
jgi:hypothetical protein